jgi:glycyl-radical enzyme activating protein
MNTPLIFDIKRTSTVDGPGARTVIFFKGCNLDCFWCHNPEGKNASAQTAYFASKCISCGACKNVCKKTERCVLCGECVDSCPTGARKMYGKAWSIDDLVELIQRDSAYYYATGGGVTFSGGECMLYPAYISELAKRCHEAGIHVAIDTAGCVPYESFEAVLPYVDMFLYDIKAIDPVLHKKGTGVSNEVILQNLEYLRRVGKKITVRTPVIPGFNEGIECERIKRYCDARALPVEFLSYHTFGEDKKDALNATAHDGENKHDETHVLQNRYPYNSVFTVPDGLATVMVYIPKFYLDEVIRGASHSLHPAFLVNGKELDGIYVSKFQNVVIDGYAHSLPGRDPAVNIDYDTAELACKRGGECFHLMTAAEWGAIALLCQKNGWFPYGNNDFGKDIREADVIARISYRSHDGKVCRVATGTGPIEWSHNRCADGIYDLNGNVWEWNSGIRLVYGELQIAPYQNADWCAIDAKTGKWLSPDGNGTTKNSVKLDFVDGAWQFISGTITSLVKEARFCAFADVTAHPSLCERAKELLYAFGVLPNDECEEYKEVSLYANNGAAERMAFRGGRWGQGRNAGVLKLCFDDPRNYSGEAVGFRSVYHL